jgi:hypothetical protein
MAANDIPLPTGGLPDISKANFYDQPPEEQEKLLSSLEDSQKALEQRYANPNWFNVAAGFLKPQLGGFAASLGSANQALGENLEKQRANELTVAQQRAQVGLMRNQMAQKARANAAAKTLSGQGGITAGQASNVAMLGGTSAPDAIQQQFTNEGGLRAQVLANKASGMSEAEIIAKLGPGAKVLLDEAAQTRPSVPGSAIPAAPVASTASTVPPESGKTQQQWDNTPLAAKNAFGSALAETNKDVAVGSLQTYQKAAEAAQPKLDLYRGMRELATSPGMGKVFGILSGNDAVSLAGKALDDGRLSDRLANIQTLLIQANVTDPDLRRRAAQLVKLINENKSTVGSSSSSPTDQATALRGAANPSLENPQTAFVALTDSLAHSEARNRDLFGILKGKKPSGEGYNASTFTTEPAFKDYTRKFMDQHSDMLLNAPKDKTPSWYAPDSGQSVSPSSSKTASAPAKSAPARSAPSGWAKQPDGSFKKVE